MTVKENRDDCCCPTKEKSKKHRLRKKITLHQWVITTGPAKKNKMSSHSMNACAAATHCATVEALADDKRPTPAGHVVA